MLEALLAVQTVGSSPDDTDFVVQSLGEAGGDFVARVAAGGNGVPVPVDHHGELFVGVEALPFHLRQPVAYDPVTTRLCASSNAFYPLRIMKLPKRRRIGTKSAWISRVDLPRGFTQQDACS